MTRHLAFAIGLVALAFPAAAQQQGTYDYEDESGSAWGSEPPAAGEGNYGEPPADDARGRVDVNVDMAAPDATVTFDTFHDRLSPYGERRSRKVSKVTVESGVAMSTFTSTRARASSAGYSL